jgi:hypothetical protein
VGADAPGLGRERVQERGLPGSGLALDQDGPAVPGGERGEDLVDEIHLGAPPDEGTRIRPHATSLFVIHHGVTRLRECAVCGHSGAANRAS